MTEQIQEVAAWAVGGTGTFVALALFLRRIFRSLGLEDAQRTTATTATNAENSVIETLREEVDRLANTNRVMSNALGELQLEIIKLRNENIALVGEIGALRNENAALTREVLRLNEQINKWSNDCDSCAFKKAAK